MKRIFSISLVIVFLPTLAANAQVFRGPFVQRVLRSPFVHDLIDFGISQIPTIPGFPAIPGLDGNARVDSTTAANIREATKNLDAADDILETILIQQKKRAEKEIADKKEREAAEATAANPAAANPAAAKEPGASIEAKLAQALGLAKNGVAKPQSAPVADLDDGEMKSLKGNILLLLTGTDKQKPSARKEVLRLLQIPEDLDLATDLAKEGDREMVLKNYEKAIKAYENALKKNRDNTYARLGLIQAISEDRAEKQAKTIELLLDASRTGKPAPAAIAVPAKVVTIVPAPLKDQSLSATGATEITITLPVDAPDEIAMTAIFKDTTTKLLAYGTIPKSKKEGTLTIVTAGAPTTLMEISIVFNHKAASTVIPDLKLKTKIQ